LTENIGDNNIYYFDKIPYINNTYLVADRNEINYSRKPWRNISDENVSLYQQLLKSGYGSLDRSFVVFTNIHNDIFERLISLIPETVIGQYNPKNELLEMLPILEDEVICIDW